MTSKQTEKEIKTLTKKLEVGKKKVETKAKTKVTHHFDKMIASVRAEIEHEKAKRPICPPPQPPTIII